MILTQNSLVLHTNELDAIETDTYINRAETVLCGSSMCRPKTTVSKITKNGVFAKDKAEYLQNLDVRETENEPLGLTDMPQFNHFDRLQPLKVPGRTKYSMSSRTKSKIRSKIIAWSQVPRKTELKFTFVTLTLTSAQIGTDKDYSKMLNTFFTYLRKFYRFDNYLYVNERQQNGNLHTHLVADIFMPIQKVNYIWCKILKANGYTFTPEGSTTAIKDFKAGKDGANPVDVAPIFNLKRLTSYITKYVTKNDSEFDCLIWNCSNTVSRLFTSVKLWDKNTFAVLYEHFRHTIQAKLSNGEVLHINLLSLYHGIQKKHFKINEAVLSGEIDREQFITKLQEQCKSKRLQAV
jgi:hypothetical protein